MAATTWAIFAAANLNPLAPLCEGAPTFDSIECRLPELLTTVNSASDLATLQTILAKRLVAAKNRVQRAQEASVARRPRAVGSLLGTAARNLDGFERQLGSRRAQRLIPAGTRSALLAELGPIRNDALVLRGSELSRVRHPGTERGRTFRGGRDVRAKETLGSWRLQRRTVRLLWRDHFLAAVFVSQLQRAAGPLGLEYHVGVLRPRRTGETQS